MSEQIKTLETMPEETKTIYTKILAAQILADGYVDPRELSDLYLFMTQINLSAYSRDEIRNFLVSEQIDITKLATQVIYRVSSDDEESIKFSIIKDLIRVAKSDEYITPKEEQNIKDVAVALYINREKADHVIQLANQIVEYDKKLLKGELSEEEYEKGAKNLASTAAAIGVPIAAIYFSGSVIGLSAAGITSGLAALGFGGLLGFSAMATGIGSVVVLGVVTYKVGRWLFGSKERELKEKRENMIQEVLKLNQRAIAAIAEDLNSLGEKMQNFASLSEENRQRIEKLKEMYQNAITALQKRESKYAKS